MSCGVSFISSPRSGHVMCCFVCGLDVHRDWCEAAFIDLFGNVAVSGRVPWDEVLSFLSKMNVSLAAMEYSGYIHLSYGFEEVGMDVLVAHPRKARLIAEDRLENDR